jgi:hypothetical protein
MSTSKITYTMFVRNDDGADEIIACGVTLPRALVIALEHGGAGKAAVVYSDLGPLRYFAIGRRRADGSNFECATYTIVSRSGHPHLDARRASEVFEQVLLQHPYEFWGGLVMSDEDYARRRGR